MKSSSLIIMLIALLAFLSGCEGAAKESDNAVTSSQTYRRGQQLLAAGSPKSAIPFLTQTVAGQPDGPEPVALLSLAYALDLQDERAILQAEQVHRPAGSPPGWELVATGIADMTQHHPDRAIAVLQRQLSGDVPDSPIAPASRQWLAMAQLLAGQHDPAIDTLKSLTKIDSMRTSSLLCMAVIYLQHSRSAEATDALMQCAKLAENTSGKLALQHNLAAADDQTLYDAAVAAVAGGDLDTANTLFTRVRDRNADAADTATWLALIAGVKRDWQTARNQLKEACDKGSSQPRGLANQLFSVVCALEDRPDAMVEYMLAGQRMLARNSAPVYIHEQPKPEPVWGADSMK